MKISHCYWHLVIKNGNFTFLLTSSNREWQIHIATDIYWSRMAISHSYWHLAMENGNLTLLLRSSGQEWHFHIATDIYWSRMVISHCYWHLVVKNGNWQIYPRICWQIYPPNASWDIYYVMYLAAIWILQEKVGISFYFWIIRLVNSQLALYSHVRCNPLDTPNTPETPQKSPAHDNYKFQLWGLIFARCNM